jgi:hypothetical protein
MGRFYCCGLAAVTVASIAASELPSTPAYAQALDYPRRAITFVVGFAPGGGIDTFARVVAQELTEQAGFSVVIEKPCRRSFEHCRQSGRRGGARRLSAAVHRQQSETG